MPPAIIGVAIAEAFGTTLAVTSAAAFVIGDIALTVITTAASFGFGKLAQALAKPPNRDTALGSGVSEIRFSDRS